MVFEFIIGFYSIRSFGLDCKFVGMESCGILVIECGCWEGF